MGTRRTGGLIDRIVATFLKGNFTVLFILITLALGAAALLITPREEEPQIVVPMADVFVQMPGASAREVEQQVSTRLERLLYQIDGVEYVYSMSRPGMAIVTVRFYVGEDREDSLVKLYNKISMHTDIVPPGVVGWVVKPVEIDDVPIVMVTLWSDRYDDHALRRIAEEVEIRLQRVWNTARTEVVGGRPRQVSVWLDPDRMAAHRVSPLQISQVLKAANVNVLAGSFQSADREILVEAGPFVRSARELEQLVVGVHGGRPVYLRDVAEVEDGPAEPDTYTRIGFGPGYEPPEGITVDRSRDYPAVTIAIAKRKGSNAVWVARDIEHELERLKGTVIPDGVHVNITRNYGETANEKVNELVRELATAIIIVVAMIAFTLGWREALVVAAAVPLTFSLTLFINYMAGYTINRVTLFALILSLGLIVDDPIVDVENIYRHFRMRKEKPKRAVLTAVREVRPPIILATLAVIFSFVPMFFITGMMGPYMRPMSLNVPVAMLMSMVVAFTVTPWLSYVVLRGVYGEQEKPYVLHETLTYRIYSRIMRPLVRYGILSYLVLFVTVGLLVLSILLVVFRLVPLKMLPFDNKNELQIVVDMPEGTTLERTQAVLDDLAAYLRTVNEVTEVLTFAGTASPMDFNGMVRHYYLRRGPNVGDIRINLVEKHNRVLQSHEVHLWIRNQIKALADKHGANVKIVEVPPGPPVLSTIVAEVYGQPGMSYEELIQGAKQVRRIMEETAGVEDVDDTVEEPQLRYVFHVDREKASTHGVSPQAIAQTLRVALAGAAPGEEWMLTAGAGVLHSDRERNPVRILLRLPREERSGLAELERLYVPTMRGDMIQLAELGTFEATRLEKTIYHKNLRRVVYVMAETVGISPPEAILQLYRRTRDEVPPQYEVVWRGEGEWKITVDVFRDLGIAFGAAVLAIYALLVYQTSSYAMPLLMLLAIPLTIIGIMPGFWLLNLAWNVPIGGYDNPVFFTATAMIGMIALAGIATRNAILLIEFVHAELSRGTDLEEAIVCSGAVRFRPIFLTAGTAMLGAWPITLDPVFSGLAWALIFGLGVSTAFTLIIVPVVYCLVYASHPTHGLPVLGDEDEDEEETPPEQ